MKIIILCVNIILLIMNLFFLIYKQIIKNKNKVNFNSICIFKFSDSKIIHIFKKSFKDISTYLSSKFNLANFIENEKTNHLLYSSKKTIKIKSIDLFDENKHYKWLKNIIGGEFEIIIDHENPDYLIYNAFGNNDINISFQNCIRIAIYTENIMPDLNYADYALGHYHVNYLDRYFKYSIFLWQNLNEINKARKQAIISGSIKDKFCAGVISNCNPNFRIKFIKKLNNYKNVDMGGKCYNNIGMRVKNKIKFLMQYKFSIAMENSGGDGYITEKIVQSFLAGTIPIYYGDFLVDEFINPKTYILIKGEKDIDEKIEYIKKIDNDNNLYMTLLREKIIINPDSINRINKKEVKEFLLNIFRQEKEKAFRRDVSFYDYQCNNL